MCITFLRLRRRRNATKSDVVREAVRGLAARELRVAEAMRPYEAVKRLIGSVNSGGLHLSKRMGEQFTSLLAERRVSWHAQDALWEFLAHVTLLPLGEDDFGRMRALMGLALLP